MRGERVAEGVARHALADPRAPRRLVTHAIQHRRIRMPAPAIPGGVAPHHHGAKQKLKRQLVPGPRTLVFQRIGDRRIPTPPRHVRPPPTLDELDLLPESLVKALRQHDHAVFVPLGRADDNLRPSQVDIPDPQRANLADPHARPVQQLRHQPVDAPRRDRFDHAPHLLDRQYRRHARNAPRPL
jgi:hypothetical protein